MLETLKRSIGQDGDYPARTFEIQILHAVLCGEIYDKLAFEFHNEKNDAGEYIPLAKRKPCVRYNLCRLLVEDSVSLLFGEGRFPSIICSDLKIMEALADVMEETGLCGVMQEAALQGSVGSTAVLMRVLDKRLFFDVMDTRYLTPEWRAMAPDTLQSVTERYKVRGDVLAAAGYSIAVDELTAMFWFQRMWDDKEEVWYLPYRVNKKGDEAITPLVDKAKTVKHNLGFVPIAWIKNLPGGKNPDGASTFKVAIETQIELEYILSQAGRGLKYSADPTLLIKEPAGDDNGPIVRSAASALIVDEKGDAKLLEINGTAAAAVLDYVRALREMALEAIHGNRSSADKVNAAQSGRALEMLHQPLIWLADKLRTSYGTDGLLPLIRMVVKARQKCPIMVFGEPMIEIPANTRLKLSWPPWFHRTTTDMSSDANRAAVMFKNGLVSRKAAVTILKEDNGIIDVETEVEDILADLKAEDARVKKEAAKVAAAEILPA